MFHQPLKTWQKKDPITAVRLQDMQERPIHNLLVAPPLQAVRSGNSVTLFLEGLGGARGGGGTLPTPQYEGQCWIGVSNNSAAFAYPFAVDTV